MKKYTIEDVRLFVVNNSNSFLLEGNDYKDNKSKLKLKCECGEIFETSFSKFKSRNKRKCNTCSRKQTPQLQALTYEEVKGFIELTSGSGCKLLSPNYNNAHEKLNILCKCGNVYETKFNHFKSSNKRQCGECGRELQAEQRRLQHNNIKKFIEVDSGSGCKLLSKTYKNAKSKIRLQCSCGNEFITLFSLFRDFDKRECGVCSQENNLTSKGELKIEKWLINNSIHYDKEVRFKDCQNKRPLPFDFVIYKNVDRKDIKLIIEYDGKQHFGIGCFSSDIEKMEKTFEQTKQNDEIKNNFCFKHSIPLLRIPYSKYASIDKILNNSLLN